MPVQFPLVNGKAHSFASITAKADTESGEESFSAIQSINYKSSKTHGVVRGNSQNVLGRTRGQREYTADMEVLRIEWESFRDKLMEGKGPEVGFGDIPFTIQVQYQEEGLPTYTDSIEQCLIDDLDASNTQGTDPTKIKLTLNPGKIKHNGKEI